MSRPPASAACGWRARTATRRRPRSTRRSGAPLPSRTQTATPSRMRSSPAPAMAARGGALLLTSGDRLPPETAARAEDAVYAVGAAAAQAVPDALHTLVGATPAETSVLVASSSSPTRPRWASPPPTPSPTPSPAAPTRPPSRAPSSSPRRRPSTRASSSTCATRPRSPRPASSAAPPRSPPRSRRPSWRPSPLTVPPTEGASPRRSACPGRASPGRSARPGRASSRRRWLAPVPLGGTGATHLTAPCRSGSQQWSSAGLLRRTRGGHARADYESLPGD